MVSSVRLMLVGRHRLFRECLVSLLEGVENFRVVAQAEDLRKAASRLSTEPADVVLLDRGSSGEGVRAGVRCLLERHSEVKLLVIGPASAQDIVECIAAGASGYLAKGASACELRQAVDGLQRGEVPCAPEVTRTLFGRLAELAVDGEDQAKAGLFELTPREVEVLELLARGLKNREIAGRLCLSPHTVKNHVHNVLGKLEASDRAEAVREALRRGWLTERRRSAFWEPRSYT